MFQLWLSRSFAFCVPFGTDSLFHLWWVRPSDPFCQHGGVSSQQDLPLSGAERVEVEAIVMTLVIPEEHGSDIEWWYVVELRVLAVIGTILVNGLPGGVLLVVSAMHFMSFDACVNGWLFVYSRRWIFLYKITFLGLRYPWDACLFPYFRDPCMVVDFFVMS